MARARTGSLYKRTISNNGTKRQSPYWYGAYRDPSSGKRRVVKLFTDKSASAQRLAELVAEAERGECGLLDATREHKRRDFLKEAENYLHHCEHLGQCLMHRHNKKAQLERLAREAKIRVLGDLTTERIERHLAELKVGGLSARSVNQHLASIRSMCERLVHLGCMSTNPTRGIKRLNERKDRRRIRRSASDDELARLLVVVRAKPETEYRAICYLLAVHAGLRRGDLKKLTWGKIDLDNSLLTIPDGKADRDDVLVLHPEVIEALRGFKPTDATPGDLVFERVPRPSTVKRDLERAGIDPLDSRGRWLDLHAFRTSLNTRLSRHGVLVQHARLVMRHADYRTTQQHYEDPQLEDMARAVGRLPAIGPHLT